jgi:hypothetical protein
MQVCKKLNMQLPEFFGWLETKPEELAKFCDKENIPITAILRLKKHTRTEKEGNKAAHRLSRELARDAIESLPEGAQRSDLDAICTWLFRDD